MYIYWDGPFALYQNEQYIYKHLTFRFQDPRLGTHHANKHNLGITQYRR